jgi:hypothetical protein
MIGDEHQSRSKGAARMIQAGLRLLVALEASFIKLRQERGRFATEHRDQISSMLNAGGVTPPDLDGWSN